MTPASPAPAVKTMPGGRRRLRMISLNRLEKDAQLRLAAGQPLDETMHTLAGLQRIQYVFVYPESNDLVLAGPAGDWTTGSEEIPVEHADRLADRAVGRLVVVFRHIMGHPDARSGCRITPTQEALREFKRPSRRPTRSRSKPGSGSSGWKSCVRNWASRTSRSTAWIPERGQPR